MLGMDDVLASRLAQLPVFHAEDKTWLGAGLRLSCYLTGAAPPLRYVSSARAGVAQDNRVLVVQDPIGKHIMPGGRLEPNESLENALRREVLEETGWSLGPVLQIGVLHYAHAGPKPEGWTHPYPDFLQVIYAARPEQHHPELIQPDEYVLGSGFESMDSVRLLPLDSGQHVFLDAAIAALGQ